MTCHIPGCDDTMSCHVMDISSYFRLALSCPVTTPPHWQITTACRPQSCHRNFARNKNICIAGGLIRSSSGEVRVVWCELLSLCQSVSADTDEQLRQFCCVSLSHSHISPVTQQSHNCHSQPSWDSRHGRIRNNMSNCWGARRSPEYTPLRQW